MALARSANQPLWRFNRYAHPIYAIASAAGCSRCTARYYSDQQPESARVEEEQHLASGSSSNIRPNLFSLLLPDDVSSQPGLSALDELNPNNASSNARLTAASIGSTEFEVWRRAVERIKESFTRPQLEQMLIDANVPNQIFRSYGVKRYARPTKSQIIKILMTHRFGMTDPDLEAELEAKRAKNKQKGKSLEIPISQIALLLLVLRGQSEMQRLLQLHRVKLKPFKREGEESLALLLHGTEPSIEIVRDWVTSFCESIQSFSCPLSSFTVSTTPIRPPSDHRLRLISQRSQAIVSLDDQGHNITIYSVEDTSLNTAQSLLVQSIHDTLLSQRRQIYSYASPPIPSDTLVSVPTYGFVPFVGPTPTPWLADPGPNASLFRITRQDIVGADDLAFSNTMQDNPDKPLLRSIKTAETYDSTTSMNDDVFNLLREQLHILDDSPGSYSYTAEFGHLLFDNHNQAGSSRVLNLVSAPLPGIWPLEHSLEWLRKASQSEDSVSTRPSFCSVIPFLAASMDAGLVPRKNAYSLDLVSDQDASPGEKLKRKLEFWADHLQQWGVPLRSNANHQLVDIVDVNASTFCDDLLLTFAGNKADLAIRLRVTLGEGEGGGEGGMVFQGAQWMQKAAADVLVPESSVDVRLSVAHSEQLTEEDLLMDEGLQRYLSEQKTIPAASVDSPDVEEGAAVLPQTAVVQGQKVFLVSAKRVCRWEWELFDDKAAGYKGKLVMEKVVQDEARDDTSTFKIVFDELQVVEVGKGEEQELKEEAVERVSEECVEHVSQTESPHESTAGKENSTTSIETSAADERSVWRVMSPLVGFFLARGYRSLPR